MAAYYHVEIAAFVAAADPKWVDNLLSRFDLPGVEAAKQGIARRISATGVQHIALARRLMVDLSIPADRAVALAQELLGGETDEIRLSELLSLRVERARFRQETGHRLSHAVESIVARRRGRPSSRPTK